MSSRWCCVKFIDQYTSNNKLVCMFLQVLRIWCDRFVLFFFTLLIWDCYFVQEMGGFSTVQVSRYLPEVLIFDKNLDWVLKWLYDTIAIILTWLIIFAPKTFRLSYKAFLWYTSDHSHLIDSFLWYTSIEYNATRTRKNTYMSV